MPLQRVFAHKIIYCGRVYSNHVAELSADGRVVFFPFEREIAMTRFYSGSIELTLTPDLQFEVREVK